MTSPSHDTVTVSLNEEEWLCNLYTAYKDMQKEFVLYKMGHKETVARVEERMFNKHYREMQLQKLVDEQRSKTVCPFCKRERSVGMFGESKCFGHGDYRGMVNVICGNCGATMTVYGDGLEGRLRGLLKWNNPTLNDKELEYELEKLIRKNLVIPVMTSQSHKVGKL